MSFTEQDLKQIEKKGLTLDIVNKQIQRFKTGIPFTEIAEAATIGNGIIRLDEQIINKSTSYFDAHKNKLEVLKFVPASGAATRMFKFLFTFLNDYKPEQESFDNFIDKHDLKTMKRFADGLEKFPFYKEVKNALASQGLDITALAKGDKFYHVVKTMLSEEALNFGNAPKGLLPFHAYKDQHVSTAFEEHLYEAALYASVNNTAALHFTISKRFKAKFNEEFSKIENDVTQHTGVSFKISYSYQQEVTDTIAVTPNDVPFREPDGSLLFRPSGHGALLKNLNAQDADIIFVKNIDNVVVKQYKEEISKYKKVLAGILLQLQTKAFAYLELLGENTLAAKDLETIEAFLENEMCVKISKGYHQNLEKDKIEYLHKKLNRPIRICGMVKNEGEPGGGPFWVKDESGNQSLQIVESAQINLEDTSQNDILKNATHFNPVDLVCGVKNYKGEKFNLENFVDHNAAFITAKTKAGKDLKALELPGLWNGSMAFWMTIFVEVPIITFNPVKTVNDLLKPQHQSE